MIASSYFYNRRDDSTLFGIDIQWNPAPVTRVSAPIVLNLSQSLFDSQTAESHTVHTLPSDSIQSARRSVDTLDYTCIKNFACCSKMCLLQFDESFIRACRLRYKHMTQAASRQWLRIMMENQPINNRYYYLDHKVFTYLGSSILLILHAFIYGQLVCRHSFMRAYGISENKMQNYSSKDKN
jgi:hypothetical protein